MDIPKAIAILSLIFAIPPSGANQDYLDATKLGIEALKRIMEYREWHRSSADGPLKGETENV